MRVPTPDVSVIDFVAIVSEPTTVDAVNAALKAAADDELRGILAYTEEPVVSSDFKQDAHSSIVDGGATRVLDGTMVRTVAWYDNEWAMRTG